MDHVRRNSCFSLLNVLFFIFFFSYKITHVVIAADTISSGQSLIGSQTLVSKDGNFELGFFTPGKSLNYYIGIWFKKISVQDKTYVWVANRDNPLKDSSSSALKLLEDGNLVVVDKAKTQVWSTNLTSNSKGLISSQLVLGDDGNLVLRNGLNESNVIWQSFDHPADTWLPGGKLRFDKKTNKSQLLTSWRNSEDPANGIFSLSIDQDGTSQYYIRRNGTVTPFWSSGIWDTKAQIFSLVPEMRLNFFYNFSYVDNKDEKYFIYDVYNKPIMSRFVMALSGQVMQVSWLQETQQWNVFWVQPRQQCEVEAYCGTFGICNEDRLPFCKCLPGFVPRYQNDWNFHDYSSGCVRNISLQCGGKNDFLTMPSVKLPGNSSLSDVNSSEECKLGCLNNCPCNAYSYGSGGCSLWSGDLLSLQELSNDDSSTRELFVKLDPSAIQSTSEDKKKGSSSSSMVIVGAVAGAIAFLGLVLILIRRSRSRGTSKTVEGSLVAFTYRDLQSATKNFSEKLGGGGFGIVSKGTLPDSTAIAVKKLEGISQGEKQFRTEVCTMGTIQHVNLVRLRGFCSEGTKRCLVYEYMPMGSLDSQLFRQKDSIKVLDWKIRFHIALGTARGLAYLHEKCRDCIIHCDIKPENILLDAEYCPKAYGPPFRLLKHLNPRNAPPLESSVVGSGGPEERSGIATLSHSVLARGVKTAGEKIPYAEVLWSGKASTLRELQTHTAKLKPDILCPSETKTSNPDVTRKYSTQGFEHPHFVVAPENKGEGLWLAWNKDINISVLSSSTRSIDSLIFADEHPSHQNGEPTHWMYSFTYDLPDLQLRRRYWDFIRNIGNSIRIPWLIIGDLNSITCKEEKYGRIPNDCNNLNPLVDLIFDTSMIDLGYSGVPFTWSNKRKGRNLIKQPLDHALASAS
ncbi:hypothetical protein GIB67_014658 [Kingdonia uniflora]|uniref:non-specific serine/threonine protein kinase n=1 Tax=Kingdonia uniflora TaxID=39325 RepID=A0A7J7LY37_9MAGN|nr:hypothetical protein GIB67_014658 [Kingdonia uniflora]